MTNGVQPFPFREAHQIFCTCASGGEQVFLDVLQQYFDGWQDERTLKLLEQPHQ